MSSFTVSPELITNKPESKEPLDPFLKWTGGKRLLSSDIVPELAYQGGTYFEPFVGGGAIFFRLRPRVACLSDVNPELIECYRIVRDSPALLARRLAQMKNSESEYYRVRESLPASEIARAARLIYLTTLSFNGIYRQNLRGEFNVPYGRKMSKDLPDYDALQSVSKALATASLEAADFEEATRTASDGDTIYFDPPYTVAHNNNGFVKYNRSIFSWEDQRRLASHAAKLAGRGCRVVVSNADHYSIRELYEGARVRVIRRNSIIAASAAFRKEITECLFIFETGG